MKLHSNSDQQSQTRSDVSKGLAYFLIGGGIGAALALLFAPKSGADLRSDISDISRKGYDETLDLAHQLKEQSADLYQSMKEKADNIYDLAAQKLAWAQDTAGDLADQAGQKINGEILNLEDKAAGKQSNSGRKASGIV